MDHAHITATAPRIPIAVLGWSLGLFLAISFALCVAFGLIFPAATMYRAWLPLLPLVEWISVPDVLLGLIESFAYGWFVALVFGPIFNFFAARASR